MTSKSMRILRQSNRKKQTSLEFDQLLAYTTIETSVQGCCKENVVPIFKARLTTVA